MTTMHGAPPPHRAQPLRRLLLAVIAGLALTAALAPASAFAHAQLESTSPARDAIVKTEPKIVSFTFGEAVSGTAGAVRVYDTSGNRVDTANAGHPGSAPQVYGVGLKPGLPKGTYTATYRIVSADSHIVSGGISFSIGAASVTRGSDVGTLLAGQQTGAQTSDAFIVARAVQYAAIAVGVGILAFLLMTLLPALATCSEVSEGGRAIASGVALGRARRLVVGAAAAGVISAVLAIGLEGAEAAGVPLWSAYTGTTLGDVLGTRFGVTWTAAGILWLLAAIAAPRLLRAQNGGARRLLWFAPLVALIALPAIAGHSSVEHPVWLLLPMNLIHVSAMTLWLGGLTALVLVVPGATRALEGADRTRLLAAVLARFSPLALACVITLLTTGIVQSLVEIDAWSELTGTAYGRAVLIKFLLLMVLIGLGAINRQRTVPQIRRLAAAGETPGVVGILLRRALRVEVAVIAVVLVITGALSGYPPAKAVASGPVSVTTAIGPQQLQLTLDPARVGANALHIYLLNPKTGAQFDATKQLTIGASLPSKSIGPIALDPRKAGPGHYVVNGAIFGAPGTWTLDVIARVSAFDEYEKKIQVRVR